MKSLIQLLVWMMPFTALATTPAPEPVVKNNSEMARIMCAGQMTTMLQVAYQQQNTWVTPVLNEKDDQTILKGFQELTKLTAQLGAQRRSGTPDPALANQVSRILGAWVPLYEKSASSELNVCVDTQLFAINACASSGDPKAAADCTEKMLKTNANAQKKVEAMNDAMAKRLLRSK